MNPAWTLLYWCAISTTTFVSSETPVCRDETGKAVDWFVTFKLPRLENAVHPLVHAGLAHATFTSETAATGFILSEKSISDPTSAPGRTLAPLYNSSDILRLLYNDQKPNSSSASESHGHTKGVVLANSSGGLWLVHSVPHFPLASNASQYDFPSTAHHYGQSMLCITLPPGQFNSLGEQLSYNYPLVYDWASPSELISAWPHLAAVAKEEHVRNPPYFSQSTLTSVGGQTFQVFAKTAKFGKDLYADWVATSLQANLLVESWPHGSGGRLPSECQLQYKERS
ncbi:hypothetical protein B566_EDAN001090 [Ephemera danica]|nr:hypothetical protein B566_EDAN001090 [Ephemera danica]